jgi:hypothetical protein
MWSRARLARCCRGCLGWSEGIFRGRRLRFVVSHPFARIRRGGGERMGHGAIVGNPVRRDYLWRAMKMNAGSFSLRLRGQAWLAWKLRSDSWSWGVRWTSACAGRNGWGVACIRVPPFFRVRAISRMRIARIDSSRSCSTTRLLVASTDRGQVHGFPPFAKNAKDGAPRFQ